jgi:hypothetical protein
MAAIWIEKGSEDKQRDDDAYKPSRQEDSD